MAQAGGGPGGLGALTSPLSSGGKWKLVKFTGSIDDVLNISGDNVGTQGRDGANRPTKKPMTGLYLPHNFGGTWIKHMLRFWHDEAYQSRLFNMQTQRHVWFNGALLYICALDPDYNGIIWTQAAMDGRRWNSKEHGAPKERHLGGVRARQLDEWMFKDGVKFSQRYMSEYTAQGQTLAERYIGMMANVGSFQETLDATVAYHRTVQDGAPKATQEQALDAVTSMYRTRLRWALQTVAPPAYTESNLTGGQKKSLLTHMNTRAITTRRLMQLIELLDQLPTDALKWFTENARTPSVLEFRRAYWLHTVPDKILNDPTGFNQNDNEPDEPITSARSRIDVARMRLEYNRIVQGGFITNFVPVYNAAGSADAGMLTDASYKDLKGRMSECNIALYVLLPANKKLPERSAELSKPALRTVLNKHTTSVFIRQTLSPFFERWMQAFGNSIAPINALREFMQSTGPKKTKFNPELKLQDLIYFLYAIPSNTTRLAPPPPPAVVRQVERVLDVDLNGDGHPIANEADAKKPDAITNPYADMAVTSVKGGVAELLVNTMRGNQQLAPRRASDPASRMRAPWLLLQRHYSAHAAVPYATLMFAGRDDATDAPKLMLQWTLGGMLNRLNADARDELTTNGYGANRLARNRLLRVSMHAHLNTLLCTLQFMPWHSAHLVLPSYRASTQHQDGLLDRALPNGRRFVIRPPHWRGLAAMNNMRALIFGERDEFAAILTRFSAFQRKNRSLFSKTFNDMDAWKAARQYVLHDKFLYVHKHDATRTASFDQLFGSALATVDAKDRFLFGMVIMFNLICKRQTYAKLRLQERERLFFFFSVMEEDRRYVLLDMMVMASPRWDATLLTLEQYQDAGILTRGDRYGTNHANRLALWRGKHAQKFKQHLYELYLLYHATSAESFILLYSEEVTATFTSVYDSDFITSRYRAQDALFRTSLALPYADNQHATERMLAAMLIVNGATHSRIMEQIGARRLQTLL
jgi:hypothetical protein